MYRNLFFFYIYAEEQYARTRICVVSMVEPPDVDIVDECAVPHFYNNTAYEYPQCTNNGLFGEPATEV